MLSGLERTVDIADALADAIANVGFVSAAFTATQLETYAFVHARRLARLIATALVCRVGRDGFSQRFAVTKVETVMSGCIQRFVSWFNRCLGWTWIHDSTGWSWSNWRGFRNGLPVLLRRRTRIATVNTAAQTAFQVADHRVDVQLLWTFKYEIVTAAVECVPGVDLDRAATAWMTSHLESTDHAIAPQTLVVQTMLRNCVVDDLLQVFFS